MKEEEVKNIIREYLSLRKKVENLQEELRGLEQRYETLGNLLYGNRSRNFIRSVVHCLAEMGAEYEKDQRYDDLFTSLLRILTNFEEYDSGRRSYTPRDSLHLYDEKVE